MAIALQHIKDDLEIVTSRRISAGLKQKSFTLMPDCLLTVINRELSVSARAVFGYLYGAYEKNCNASNVISPVVISGLALGSVINRSERTARRAIAELTKKGFVKIQHRFKKSGLHNSNAIYPIIPTSVAAELLKFPDRATSAKNQSCNKVNCCDDKQTFINKNNKIKILAEAVTNNTSVGQKLTQGKRRLCPDISRNFNDPSKTTLRCGFPGQSLYHNYIKAVDELKQVGIGVLKSHQKARLDFTKEQIKEIEAYLAEEKRREIKSSALSVSSYHDKNGMHKILNNNIVNNSRANVDNSLVTSKTHYSNAAVVNLNTKINADYIEKSIRKFIGSNSVPGIIFRNKSITDIVEEVKFHVEHRNLNKTKSAVHALNAAKAMLKAGRWRTPKKFAWVKSQEAIARERNWQQEKQQELLEIKNFIENKETMHD